MDDYQLVDETLIRVKGSRDSTADVKNSHNNALICLRRLTQVVLHCSQSREES